MRRMVLSGLCIGLTVLGVATVCFAAGFQVPEQGAVSMGMGMAFIGKADDLSAIYHNPAGLTQLQGTHLYLGLRGRRGRQPDDSSGCDATFWRINAVARH